MTLFFHYGNCLMDLRLPCLDVMSTGKRRPPVFQHCGAFAPHCNSAMIRLPLSPCASSCDMSSSQLIDDEQVARKKCTVVFQRKTSWTTSLAGHAIDPRISFSYSNGVPITFNRDSSAWQLRHPRPLDRALLHFAIASSDLPIDICSIAVHCLYLQSDSAFRNFRKALVCISTLHARYINYPTRAFLWIIRPARHRILMITSDARSDGYGTLQRRLFASLVASCTYLLLVTAALNRGCRYLVRYCASAI